MPSGLAAPVLGRVSTVRDSVGPVTVTTEVDGPAVWVVLRRWRASGAGDVLLKLRTFQASELEVALRRCVGYANGQR